MILQELEGYRVEFKEKPANLDKELVAFANASGGRIFIGIDDDGVVKGVSIDNLLKTQVQDVANNCDPRIRISLEEFRNLLIVHVPTGDDKPYKCSTGFYLRVGPNSQKMKRDEIVAFIKSEGKVRFDELVSEKFKYNKDFDPSKLDSYLKIAGITKMLGTKEMLVNLGGATFDGDALVVNNAGVLFFTKDLNSIYPHAAVTCALYKGTEKWSVLDRKDFNDDIVSNIESALTFLKQNLPVRYEMTGHSRRSEVLQIPEAVLREAVINAVAHRDYFQYGANVMVEIFDDRVEISNPGGLVKGLTPENFGKRSVLRNPNIASLLHRGGYVEKIGTGVSRMREILKQAELPPPEFEFNSFFTVTLRRPVKRVPVSVGDPILDAVHDGVRDGVLDSVDDDVAEGVREGIHEGDDEGVKKRLAVELLFAYQRDGIAIRDIQQYLGISKATAERDARLLKERGYIIFSGTSRRGKYRLTKKGWNAFKKAKATSKKGSR